MGMMFAYNCGAALFLLDRFPEMSADMTFCAIQVKNQKNDSLASGINNKAVSSLESVVEVQAMNLSGN